MVVVADWQIQIYLKIKLTSDFGLVHQSRRRRSKGSTRGECPPIDDEHMEIEVLKEGSSKVCVCI